MIRLVALGAVALVQLASTTASAEYPGCPPRGHAGAYTVPLVGRVETVPATFELAPWIGVGAGWRKGESGGIASFGVGVDGTFGVATFAHKTRCGGPGELRMGPWLAFESPGDRVRAEGGLATSIGQTKQAQFGTFGFKLGGGASTIGVPHLTWVFTWGVRDVPARTELRGVCASPKEPDALALASGARLFATMRSTLAETHTVELVFGVELEPTWLLPPYSWQKLVGAPR